jgi:uncharacterized membrane protein
MLTMRNIYWIVVACVLAAIVHMVTLIFIPGMVFERSLKRVAVDVPENRFFLLTSDAQRKMFPEYPPNAIFGLCRFDLSKGPVALNANLPDGFWTLTVYSKAGKTLYTVNDLQSGTNTFNLQLEKAPGLIESFSAKADDDLVSSSGWKVRSTDVKGLALFWVPGNDPALRESLSAELSKSSCARVSS